MSSNIDRKILVLEEKIASQKRELARLRAERPLMLVPDYELVGQSGKRVKLSALFGRKKELILVHNMGAGCSYCTMWADGFNGVVDYLESRAAFAMESPDAPKEQRALARSRKWRFAMVSSQGTSFRRDSGFEMPDGSPVPGVSAFVKKGRSIYRYSKSIFGPGDNYCVVWDLFDLLPGGPGKWQP